MKYILRKFELIIEIRKSKNLFVSQIMHFNLMQYLLYFSITNTLEFLWIPWHLILDGMLQWFWFQLCTVIIYKNFSLWINNLIRIIIFDIKCWKTIFWNLHTRIIWYSFWWENQIGQLIFINFNEPHFEFVVGARETHHKLCYQLDGERVDI